MELSEDAEAMGPLLACSPGFDPMKGRTVPVPAKTLEVIELAIGIVHSYFFADDGSISPAIAEDDADMAVLVCNIQGLYHAAGVLAEFREGPGHG